MLKTKTILQQLEGPRNNGQAQSFVCPTCMMSFHSPEFLQSHFEGVHDIQEGGGVTAATPGLSSGKTNIGNIGKLMGKIKKSDMFPIRKKTDSESDKSERSQTLSGSGETLKDKILANQIVKSVKESAKLINILEKKEIAKEDTVDVVPGQEEDETLLYKNQIAALEESKELLISEVYLLKV